MDHGVSLDQQSLHPFAITRAYRYITRIEKSDIVIAFVIGVEQMHSSGKIYMHIDLDFDDIGRIACRELNITPCSLTLKQLWKLFSEHNNTRCFYGDDKKIRYVLNSFEVMDIFNNCYSVPIVDSDTSMFIPSEIRIDCDAIDWLDTSQNGLCIKCIPLVEHLVNNAVHNCVEAYTDKLRIVYALSRLEHD